MCTSCPCLPRCKSQKGECPLLLAVELVLAPGVGAAGPHPSSASLGAFPACSPTARCVAPPPQDAQGCAGAGPPLPSRAGVSQRRAAGGHRTAGGGGVGQAGGAGGHAAGAGGVSGVGRPRSGPAGWLGGESGGFGLVPAPAPCSCQATAQAAGLRSSRPVVPLPPGSVCLTQGGPGDDEEGSQPRQNRGEGGVSCSRLPGRPCGAIGQLDLPTFSGV